MRVRYKTLVADPPWPQKGGGPLCGEFGEGFAVKGSRPSRPMPYATLTVEQIAAFSSGIQAVMAKNAHLYLWTTNRFLADAFQVVRAWGFTPSTTLVWAKNPMGHGLGGTYGLATEFVLFARRGRLQHGRRIGRNWFNWKRPYDSRGKPRHSAKPSEFFDMVELVSPGPYLELFARNARAGWDAWGDEVEERIRWAPNLEYILS